MCICMCILEEFCEKEHEYKRLPSFRGIRLQTHTHTFYMMYASSAMLFPDSITAIIIIMGHVKVFI